MAVPRRRADWGSEASILEDLRLARDAGGIDRADASRLEASVRVRFGTRQPTSAQLQNVREWLREHVSRGSAAYAVMHRGDPIAAAAAHSAQTILMLAADDRQTARSIRTAAVVNYQCFIVPDSLRKREVAVLAVIAQSVFADTDRQDTEMFSSIDVMLDVLAPRADLAATTVGFAAKIYSQRAELDDDTVFLWAIQHALFAVAQLGVLPAYGLDRLRVLGVHNPAEEILEFMLRAIIEAPFRVEPRDLSDLATATRVDETAEQLYERLTRTPIMRPLIQRFVVWLGGHDPKTCLFYSNDVMIGYCSPHYYVALCHSLTSAQEDWASGDFQADASALFLGLSKRAPGHQA